jgi:hypothetical protein
LATSDGAYGPPAAAPGALVRDVTSTLKEFDASLRQAAAGCIEGQAPTYLIKDGEVRLQIDIVPGAERRIALVRLPTLIVTYRFIAGSRGAQEALLARLDRAMHRGGG